MPQLKPDRSQLLFLKQDKTFQWVYEQLEKTFPQWPSNLPAKSLEENHLKAGQQQVIQKIQKLLKDEI